ncbi:Trehalase [Psidium guajava]|nr:Trehalase [Psidium guajava]
MGSKPLTHLANVANRKLRGEGVKKEPLVLARQLVRGVEFHDALGAERSLVGTADQRYLGSLAHVAPRSHRGEAVVPRPRQASRQQIWSDGATVDQAIGDNHRPEATRRAMSRS